MKLSYVHYNIGQSEAKQRILKLNSVVHHLPSVGPKDVGVKRVLPRLYKRRSKGKEAAIQVLKFSKEAFFFLLPGPFLSRWYNKCSQEVFS